MVNGTISVYTYDDNWNYIHMSYVYSSNYHTSYDVC
jgi:hypothetical protein